MSLFCCPICGGPLDRGPSAYSCPAGHSFDLAREGYVHLLPANRMHSKMPGDDKGMAAARLPGCWTPAAARGITPAGCTGPWSGRGGP